MQSIINIKPIIFSVVFTLGCFNLYCQQQDDTIKKIKTLSVDVEKLFNEKKYNEGKNNENIVIRTYCVGQIASIIEEPESCIGCFNQMISVEIRKFPSRNVNDMVSILKY